MQLLKDAAFAVAVKSDLKREASAGTATGGVLCQQRLRGSKNGGG